MSNDKDSVVLEPCPVPWCGSPDVKARSFDANHRRHWIECGKCNFKTPQMPSRTKVITLWNTRQTTQRNAIERALCEANGCVWDLDPDSDSRKQWRRDVETVLAALQEQSK